jgi:DNA-binding MurR/RpiR family transcriptional regulator
MSTELFERLQRGVQDFTPAERRIANHLLTHRASVPFETAASLAAKLGLSAVTVGRFCRALGFRHFRALKENIRTHATAAPWLVGDQLKRFRETYANRAELRRSLDLEMAALVEAYALIDTPLWNGIVKLLAHAAVVHIAGFQTERGLALMLANALQYVREGVELVDCTAGHYVDVFDRRMQRRCLVVIDNRRFSRQTYLLASQAASRRLPLIMITDKHCDWARQFTPHVLAVGTDNAQFWSSPVAQSGVINQLVNSVIVRSGQTVEKRLTQISKLYAGFVGFVEAADRGGSPVAR